MSKSFVTICCLCLLLLSPVVLVLAQEKKQVSPVLPSEIGVFNDSKHGKCYILLIGINKYPDLELYTCNNDVMLMRDTFISLGVPSKNITLLSDKNEIDGMKNVLSEDFPSKERVQSALNDILSKVEHDDSIIVAFSGHGFCLDNKKNREEETYINQQSSHFNASNIDLQDYYLCLKNSSLSNLSLSSCISLGWLRDCLDKVNVRFKMIVVDACLNPVEVKDFEHQSSDKNSGASFKTENEENKPEKKKIETEETGNKPEENEKQSKTAISSTVILTGCMPKNKSYSDYELGHGLLSYYFCLALSGNVIFQEHKKDSDWQMQSDDEDSYFLDSDILPASRGQLRLGTFYEYVKQMTVKHSSAMDKTPQCPVILSEKSPEIDNVLLYDYSVGRPMDDLPILFRNAVGMQFKKISPGTIKTFSPENGSPEVLKNDHVYYIAVYELTQREYLLITGANPAFHVQDTFDCLQCPVENISLKDIFKFLKNLNRKMPLSTELPFGGDWEYSIPTCEEWEYALFSEMSKEGLLSNSFQDVSANLLPYAWCGENSNCSMPVGMKKPFNSLFDMYGNVAEWCMRKPIFNIKGNTYSYSGGSWRRFSTHDVFRPSYRAPSFDVTSEQKYEEKYSNVGIRLVLRKSNKNNLPQTVGQPRKTPGNLCFAVSNRSPDRPLIIYLKNPVRERIKMLDILVLRPQSTFCFDKEQQIFLQTKNDGISYFSFTTNEEKVLSFTYNVEEAKWNKLEQKPF